MRLRLPSSTPSALALVPWTVAVGMSVTRHPPHRARRAALPHRALAAGHNAQAVRGLGRQEVGWRPPGGGEGVEPRPGAPRALAAPSAGLTPRAEEPGAQHPSQAHVARPPSIPSVPWEPTPAPGSQLPAEP